MPYQALALDVSESGSRDPEADRAGSRTRASSAWSWSCPGPARSSGRARSRASIRSVRRTHFSGLHFVGMAHQARAPDSRLRAGTPRALAAPVHPAPDLHQPLRLPLLVAAPKAFQDPRSALDARNGAGSGAGFFGRVRAPHARGPATRAVLSFWCAAPGARHGLARTCRRRAAGARRLAGSSYGLERAARTRRARAARTPRRRRPRAAARQAGGTRRPDEAARAVSRRAPNARRPKGGKAAYAPLAAYAHLLQALGDAKAACAAFDQVLRVAPQSVPAIAGRARALADAGDDAAALAAYDDALKLEHRAPARRRLIDAALAILARSGDAPDKRRPGQDHRAAARAGAHRTRQRRDRRAPGRRAGTRGQARGGRRGPGGAAPSRSRRREAGAGSARRAPAARRPAIRPTPRASRAPSPRCCASCRRAMPSGAAPSGRSRSQSRATAGRCPSWRASWNARPGPSNGTCWAACATRSAIWKGALRGDAVRARGGAARRRARTARDRARTTSWATRTKRPRRSRSWCAASPTTPQLVGRADRTADAGSVTARRRPPRSIAPAPASRETGARCSSSRRWRRVRARIGARSRRGSGCTSSIPATRS